MKELAFVSHRYHHHLFLLPLNWILFSSHTYILLDCCNGETKCEEHFPRLKRNKAKKNRVKRNPD